MKHDADHRTKVLVLAPTGDPDPVAMNALASGNYDVVSACNTAQAAELASRQRLDLIVIDVLDPELAGDDVVRAVRDSPELRAIPIVLVTTRVTDEVRAALCERRVDDFVIEPFSSAELCARVECALERTRAASELATSGRRGADLSEAVGMVSEAIGAVAETSVHSVLQTIALSAQSLTGAEYVGVGIGLDPDRVFDWWVTTGMSLEAEAAIGHRPRPVGLLGPGVALRLRDLHDHPDHRGLPPGHPPMTSFLRAPIRCQGRAVGQLYLTNKRGGDEFTVMDQHVVEMLGARAGTAIETALLYRAEGMGHVWLQAVVDQMPEGVVLFDAAGRATAHNRAMLALSDGSLDREPAAVGIDLRTADGARIAAVDLPSTRALQTRNAVFGVELAARRRDGVLIPVAVSAAPVHAADGSLAGATMIVRDISATREIERTRQEWLTIISHDLMQPVNSILLAADLLLRGSVDVRQRDTLERIRKGVTQLTRLIRDLMDASLLETHRLTLQTRSIDLCALTREMVASCPASGRIRLETTGSAVVECDPDRLQQVVHNLISNAVKYGHPGTEIGVAVAAANGVARIEITNRGIAIPPDELDTLFDRYVRARSAKQGKVAGSGLGLYIAKGLVEAHGGQIWATSGPGDATVFHIALPLSTER